MRTLLVALLLSSAAIADPAKLTFTKVFPGSVPEYTRVEVDRAGQVEYKTSPQDNQPITAHLQEPDTAMLFSLAEKLNNFKFPLDANLKVADTGRKTFRYTGEDGNATEVSFNYSTNTSAQRLWELFEQIAATERAYAELDRTIHYDKLGINDALAEIESLWVHKSLAAPPQFIPLLTRISTHDTYMHLVRERAARLKDEFTAAYPDAAPTSAQE